MHDNLYQLDSIELAFGDDPIAAWREHCSMEAYIESVVSVAKRVLANAGYDTTQPPNLLIGGFRNKETRPEAGLCVGAMEIRGTAGAADECVIAARVLYHADQRARGMRSGCMVTVERHAIKLSHYVACAQHLEAWGKAVRQKRKRDAANQKNIARHNAEVRAKAEEDRAPWREPYRALRASGMSKAAARREIGSRISEAGGPSLDGKTLRKWFPG